MGHWRERERERGMQGVQPQWTSLSDCDFVLRLCTYVIDGDVDDIEP